MIEPGVAPHAVAGFAQKQGEDWLYAVGSGDGKEARPFDLASISKSIFAVALAKLVNTGALNWHDRLSLHLPELEGLWAGKQTIEAHLSHRAGMLAHIELFRETWGGQPFRRRSLLRRIARAGAPAPQMGAVYSDLGYLLLGELTQRISGKNLDEVVADRVLRPWQLDVGSARMMGLRMPDFARQVAPTEIQPGRGGPLRGVVHDDNSWMWAGTGICGHAGLFGTADALLQFGARLLDEQSQPYLRPLLERRPGGTLRMGFDGIRSQASSAGKLAGPETFGHLGFTGTSLWCDPERQRVTVLLTNRVYPTRENPQIREIRPNVHDFLWSC